MESGADVPVLSGQCAPLLAPTVPRTHRLHAIAARKQKLVQQLREEMSASEAARARAEEANLAKSKFLAAASHDLRQPLQAMNLFIEALRNERIPSAPGRYGFT